MRKIMLSFLMLMLLNVTSAIAQTADYNVVPRPQTITLAKEGAYLLDGLSWWCIQWEIPTWSAMPSSLLSISRK